MTVAWFRPAVPDLQNPLDDTAVLAATLAPGHTIEMFDLKRASNFVWAYARRKFDLCVYELADTSEHQFIWPYLLHYPGVLLLRDESLQSSRAEMLWHRRQIEEYAAEFKFDHGFPPPLPLNIFGVVRGGWPMLRAPLLASRLVVVRDHSFEADLREQYPGVPLRHVPIGVREPTQVITPSGGPLRVGILDTRGRAISDRIQRLVDQQEGCEAHLVGATDASRVILESHVVVVIEWPARREPPIAALAAMAAAKPTIVLETNATASWPALDPQTWQPRGRMSHEAPVVLSMDPRDEEHSLTLSLQRLARDVELRVRLGTAARAWWQAHATVEQATNAWRSVLAEAASLSAQPPPPTWPPHLSADGSEQARTILSELGLEFTLPGFAPR